MGTHLGKTLRFHRKQAGMSREKLAEDICAPSTLWRIEEGHTMPSKRNLNLLFQKLGLNPDSFNTIWISNEEAEIQKLTDALDRHLVSRSVDEATKVITTLENNEKFMKDKLNEKHIFLAKAANMINMNEEVPLIFESLIKAIHIAPNKFCEDDIEKYPLTKTDFAALNLMATQYFALGEQERAVRILYGLKRNVENICVDDIERGKRYPTVIFNLTKYLSIMGKHDEVMKLCDEGKAVCLATRYLRLVPDILFNKVYSLFANGDVVEGEKLLRDVYHTLCLFDRHKEAQLAKNYADELGIVL